MKRGVERASSGHDCHQRCCGLLHHTLPHLRPRPRCPSSDSGLLWTCSSFPLLVAPVPMVEQTTGREHDRLEAHMGRFNPSQLITTVFVVPYLIVLLAFFPNTRWIRICLWPVGVIALYYAAGCLNDPSESGIIRADHISLVRRDNGGDC